MMNSFLFDSKFIIDGLPMELTPRQILGGNQCTYPSESIVDESLDPSVGIFELDENRLRDYLALVLKQSSRKLLFPFAGEYARTRVALALLDAIWTKGHFVLEDLSLSAHWHWADKGVGSMAALYESVAGLAGYATDLYLQIGESSINEGEPCIEVKVAVPESERALPSRLEGDADSWLIYVPFDTSEYKLGGSLLSQALGVVGGPAPKVEDTGYFGDCFEVVREFVEDGVAISGCTVGDGGLMAALDSMCRDGVGIDADISDICRAAGDTDPVRVLFSEIPGVLFQIRDSDFDYVDAELLLQDVMYFPLGHPRTVSSELKIISSRKTAIGNILEALMRSFSHCHIFSVSSRSVNR